LLGIFNIGFSKEINVDIFWQNKDDKNYKELIQVLKNKKEANVREYDVTKEKNKEAMLYLVDYFKASLPATPFVVVGEDAFVYFQPAHKERLLANIANCQEKDCQDIVKSTFALLEDTKETQPFKIPILFYVTGFLTLVVCFLIFKNIKKNKNEKNN